MYYILIDYEKYPLPNLQHFLTIDSEIYLFFDSHKHGSIPLSWIENFLNYNKRIDFIEIDLEKKRNMSLHWAFIVGQIIAKDKMAKIKILADKSTFSFLLSLSKDIDIEWISSTQKIEKKTEISSQVSKKLSQTKTIDNKLYLEPQEREISQLKSAEITIEKNTEKEEKLILHQPKENKKERLRKKAIFTNKAEFIRFTTNYIFNLFSTHLYLQKITPPSLFIDLKNLLITEYFPPEEDFALSEHTDKILENVFSRLKKKGFISIEEDNVSYYLTPDLIYQNFLKLINHQKPKKYNGIVHIAKTELFFLGNDEESIKQIIEKVKNNGHFSIQNKRVIYPTKKINYVPKAKNNHQQQSFRLKGIKVKKDLSAHHPKVSLFTPRLEKVKKDNDFQFRLALQLIKSPNRPKSIKHLKQFLTAKIATSSQGIDQLIKRLFKERHIIVLNDDKITYRTEIIRSSRYEKVVHFLKNGSQFKPKEEEALLNAIQSCLGNKISQAECQAIVKQLIDDHYITIENGIAKYQL